MLNTGKPESYLERLRLPLMGEDELRKQEHKLRPAIHIGKSNHLRFEFSFPAIIGSAQRDTCQALLPPDIRASISPDSSIDFSGFHHYIAMPNLRAFAGSAYPFSRLADLSETVVVLPENPTAIQIATFLEVIGDMGGQIGYPALKMRLSNDWHQAKVIDADILLIGDTPQDITINEGVLPIEATVRSVAPMATIVGLQSDFHPKRSVVGLFASSDADYTLLREALASSGKRDAMSGSVVLIRESGVHSEMVGPVYYLGHLPWWEHVWYVLSEHPIWLALLAFALIVIIAILLWNALRLIARKRLNHDTDT